MLPFHSQDAHAALGCTPGPAAPSLADGLDWDLPLLPPFSHNDQRQSGKDGQPRQGRTGREVLPAQNQRGNRRRKEWLEVDENRHQIG